MFVARFLLLVAATLYCNLLLAEASFAQSVGKPNIVFILTDDQAADCLAAWGTWGNDHSIVQTPNLDRLVQRGTSFRRAYNMGSFTGAVCVASRAMLLSGRYLWAAQAAETTEFRELIEAKRTWPQRMKNAGYATYFAGKWHVAAPVNTLFEQVRNVRPGMPPTVEASYQRPPATEPDGWRPWDTTHGGYWQGGQHWSEVLVDDAIAFLRHAASETKPFFMYLAFNAPHDPRQSPREYVERYPFERVPVPENFLPTQPFHEAMGLGTADRKGLRDEVLAPFPRTEQAIRLHRQEYYALVTHTDAQIGRILAALEASTQLDNTIIIFTSDHGLAVGRHGLMGKQNMFEHSVRVPWVIAGPGIPAGQSIEAPIYLQDAMATALDLAGADQHGLDFQSLLPLIRGQLSETRSSIYAAYLADRQRAILQGDLKLILYPTIGKSLLFDLAADPLEMHNLAEQPDSVPAQRKLFAELRTWQNRIGDPLDLVKVFPDLNRDIDH